MNIHEYQAKEILSKFGVSIPKGGIAYSPENAKDRATELGGDLWLLATGTGIAPFVSILRDMCTYDSFENIHVAWSVRDEQELDAYKDFISEMPVRFIPIVTQSKSWRGIDTRITNLLDWRGILTNRDPLANKVMICGSINFNTDVKTRLTAWGWSEGNKRTAGTFVQEKAFVEK